MRKIKKVNVEQISSFVSNEVDITPDEVLKMYESQFSFIANHIKKGKEEVVKLDYFGKFTKKVFIKKRR
jgi:nucleoid DNA-binding protein